ncbi:MAG TPA: hypothetical protein VNU44_17950 [Bryobacteraceae bacterium]|jgi:hypothetical protein|nr:hypothetical protein [Bryobacteraceae bacterium]
MIPSFLVPACVLLSSATLALADSNTKSLRPLVDASTPIVFNGQATVDLYIDQTKAAFRSTEVAGDFLNRAIEQFAVLRPANKKEAKNSYYLIHLLRWKDPQQAADPSNPVAEPGFSLTVDVQNWYVYHQGNWSTEDFSSRNRLYGAKTVYLLYLELNAPAGASIRPIYTLNYVEKTADNVNHLLSLISLFLPSGAAGGAMNKTAKSPDILWGGGRFDQIHTPSDVTVSVTFESGPANTDKAAATKAGSDTETDSVSSGPQETALEPKAAAPVVAKLAPASTIKSDSTAANTSPTFDNEGKYWWDVSVAVPVRQISQTTIDTTAGTISPKQVKKENSFAAVDLYPFRVDTKRQVNYMVPHFVGGVAIASQPLHKILLAAGFGPAFANFYIGAALVMQPQVPGVSAVAAGGGIGNSFSPQLTFGINLQVKAFQSALSKSK